MDIQPHIVTCLAWPQNKSLMDGRMGLTVDTLLVGRLDGSIGLIQVIDPTTFIRKELENCYRKDGEVLLIFLISINVLLMMRKSHEV